MYTIDEEIFDKRINRAMHDALERPKSKKLSDELEQSLKKENIDSNETDLVKYEN